MSRFSLLALVLALGCGPDQRPPLEVNEDGPALPPPVDPGDPNPPPVDAGQAPPSQVPPGEMPPGEMPPVEMPPEQPPGPVFGGPADVQHAEQLWAAMGDYRDWPSYPDLEGYQDSNAPHGAYVRFFINPLAALDPAAPGPGSVIIKENFEDQDEDTLAAITVMQKVAGYDAEIADWFFAKYLPDGALDVNGAGVPLAGRVGKGGEMGCVPCHRAAGGGDYLFINDGFPRDDPEDPPVEDPEDPPVDGPPEDPPVGEATFGTAADLQIASLVWFEMEDVYRDWAPYPGKEGFVESSAPHGAFVKFYLNRAAAGDPANPPGNSLIVKENYADASPETLGAITVMKKIQGYNPDEADWFFAKYRPDGTVDTNPAGVPLAGRVGKGGDSGCIPCHRAAADNDFFFANDPPPVVVPDDAPFGTANDELIAALVWNEMRGYRGWGSYPGKEGFQPSNAPHGSVVRFFLNDVAAQSPSAPADQGLIIKENFAAEEEGALGAITVMKKIRGYSPGSADWFFAKYLPDGQLDRNADGWPLAGRVGMGGATGCVPCHAAAGGGDFLFIND